MFNPELPNNHLAHLPINVNFKDIDLLVQLNSTNIALADLTLQCSEIPNSDILTEALSIKESVESDKIESIHTTIENVFQSNLSSSVEIKQQDKEALNYAGALYRSFWKMDSEGGISLSELFNIHGEVLGKYTGIVSNPGKKITLNDTISGKKKTLYTPPVGEELIKDLLHNFLDYFHGFEKEKDIDPLLKLPLLHHQFESIHPFGDGNGRVGRILIIAYLYLHKKINCSALYMSEFLLRNEKDYKEYLTKLDKNREGNIIDFTLWFLVGLENQALKTSTVIMNIRILMFKTEKTLYKSKDIQDMYIPEFLKFLFKKPFYSIDSGISHFSKNRKTISKYLNNLEKIGILTSFQSGRNNRYVFKEYFDLLDK